jgi:hypothetical protein
MAASPTYATSSAPSAPWAEPDPAITAPVPRASGRSSDTSPSTAMPSPPWTSCGPGSRATSSSTSRPAATPRSATSAPVTFELSFDQSTSATYPPCPLGLGNLTGPWASRRYCARPAHPHAPGLAWPSSPGPDMHLCLALGLHTGDPRPSAGGHLKATTCR